MKEICAIVGRFQVPELTDGHKNILEYAINNFKRRILILGVPPTRFTKFNPLDFESRRQMIEENYPSQFEIMYLKDINSDGEWSKSLDKLISSISKDKDIILIGTKDSLMSHYIGNMKVKIIESDKIEFNQGNSRTIKDSQWRKGVFESCQNRYPTVYPTVDCAIFDDSSFLNMWLAKKPHEDKLRLVGGFADPNDSSFEETAIREALEETGMKCEIVSWIGSQKIDDWRYRNERDKIITNLFAMMKISGMPMASDDILELHLVPIMNLDLSNVQPEHRELIQKIKHWVSSKYFKQS